MSDERAAALDLARTCARHGATMAQVVDLRFHRWDALESDDNLGDFSLGMLAVVRGHLPAAKAQLKSVHGGDDTVSKIEYQLLTASIARLATLGAKSLFLEVEAEGTGQRLVAFDVLGSGVGERVLVAQGLKVAARGANPGMAALAGTILLLMVSATIASIVAASPARMEPTTSTGAPPFMSAARQANPSRVERANGGWSRSA